MLKKSSLNENLIEASNDEALLNILLNIKDVNQENINAAAEKIKSELNGRPIKLEEMFNPSDELLQRAKYLSLVAVHENAKFARNFLSHLIELRAVANINPSKYIALDFETEVLPNPEKHNAYIDNVRVITNSLHLIDIKESLKYSEFLDRVQFKKELKDYLQFFVEHERDVPSTLFKLLKFSEFLTKKFPHMTPEAIKEEVKSYFEELKNETKPFATSLILSDIIFQEASDKLQEKSDENSASIMQDLQFGIECLKDLTHAHKAEITKISDADMKKVTKLGTKFVVDDLIPHTPIRRALDKELEEMKNIGLTKLKTIKERDVLGKEQANVLIETPDKLSELSNKYFMSAVKSDEKKQTFRTNCENEITRANEILGKNAPLKWKNIVKNVLFIVSVIVTAGIALAVKAAHQKLTTGSISIFESSQQKKGKKRLSAIKEKVLSQHFKPKIHEDDKNSIEMSISRKRSKPTK